RRLIDDLLSLNRIETDERNPPTARVDLSALTEAVLADLAPQSEAQGAQLSADIAPGIVVTGDEAQLAQAIRNLVENALRYGGNPPRVQVTLARTAPDAQGRNVVLSVADRGPGIAPEHIPRLTERFYRVDAHRSRAAGGTGLGLAIVKHVAARHRGRLVIDSTPGQGSRFALRLVEAQNQG
ncbi:MAG: two-component sensor histidine kinase, partial [Alphaproteobacteria bacterium]